MALADDLYNRELEKLKAARRGAAAAPTTRIPGVNITLAPVSAAARDAAPAAPPRSERRRTRAVVGEESLADVLGSEAAPGAAKTIATAALQGTARALELPLAPLEVGRAALGATGEALGAALAAPLAPLAPEGDPSVAREALGAAGRELEKIPAIIARESAKLAIHLLPRGPERERRERELGAAADALRAAAPFRSSAEVFREAGVPEGPSAFGVSALDIGGIANDIWAAPVLGWRLALARGVPVANIERAAIGAIQKAKGAATVTNGELARALDEAAKAIPAARGAGAVEARAMRKTVDNFQKVRDKFAALDPNDVAVGVPRRRGAALPERAAPVDVPSEVLRIRRRGEFGGARIAPTEAEVAAAADRVAALIGSPSAAVREGIGHGARFLGSIIDVVPGPRPAPGAPAPPAAPAPPRTPEERDLLEAARRDAVLGVERAADAEIGPYIQKAVNDAKLAGAPLSISRVEIVNADGLRDIAATAGGADIGGAMTLDARMIHAIARPAIDIIEDAGGKVIAMSDAPDQFVAVLPYGAARAEAIIGAANAASEAAALDMKIGGAPAPSGAAMTPALTAARPVAVSRGIDIDAALARAAASLKTERARSAAKSAAPARKFIPPARVEIDAKLGAAAAAPRVTVAPAAPIAAAPTVAPPRRGPRARAAAPPAPATQAPGAPPTPPRPPAGAAAPAAPVPPGQSGIIAATRAQIVPPEPKTKTMTRMNWLQRLRTFIVDDVYPVELMEAAAAGRLPADKIPSVLIRAYRANAAAADVFIDVAPIDFNTLKLRNDIKSLRSAVAPVEDRLDDFEAYLVMRRAAELAASPVSRLRKSGDLLIEQIGAGTPRGLTANDLNAELAAIEAAAPDFAAAAADINKWHDALIDYLGDSGRYSPEAIDAIRELHKNYVPLRRALTEDEPELLRAAKVKPQSPIRKLEGGTSAIVSPLASMVQNTSSIIRTANKNEIFAQLAELADTDATARLWMQRAAPTMEMTTFELEDIKKALAEAGIEFDADQLETIAKIFRPVRGGVKNEITVYRDGVAQNYRVDPAIFAAVQSLEPSELSLVIKFMSLASQLFHSGVVFSPTFAINNITRDTIQAAIQGKGIPLVSYARGVFELFRRGDLYQRWRAGGGQMFSAMAADMQLLEREVRRDPGTGTFSAPGLKRLLRRYKNMIVVDPKNPRQMAEALAKVLADMGSIVVRGLGTIAEFGESPTRLDVFGRTIEKPSAVDLASDRPERAAALRAVMESRDASTDFLRHGAGMRSAIAITRFLNPAIQGPDKMFRTMRDNPGKSMMVAGTMMLVEYLLHEHNKDKPEYQSVPPWVRDIAWVYVTNDGRVLLWPAPHGWKVLFGSIPRRIFEYIDEEDPDANMNAVIETALRGFSFPIPGTVATPLVTNYFNWNTFSQRPLIPQSLEEAEPGEQFTPGTTEAAKRIGAAFGYAPIKIDNLIRGYSGTLGFELTKSIDAILRDRDFGEAPTPRASDLPVIRAFIMSTPRLDAEPIERFYNYLTIAKTAERTRDILRDDNRLTPAWERENAWKLGAVRALTKTAARFRVIRREMVAVERNPELAGAAKRETLDGMAQAIINEASAINKEIISLKKELEGGAGGGE